MRPTEEMIDQAKQIRAEYGRGQKKWREAKDELVKMNWYPDNANGILLGTMHLPGD